MLTRLFLCFTLAARFANCANGDLYELFLAAKPLYPTIALPDTATVEKPNIRLETLLGGYFNALSSCSKNETLENGDFGVITTPNYPENYPGGLSCEWNLVAPEKSRIQISFYDLYTQPWFFTYFDYVTISKDGSFTNEQRIAGDMNSKVPFVILSEANKIGIRFRSSALFNYRGIKFQYLVRPADPDEVLKVFEHPYNGECGLSAILSAEDETTRKPESFLGIVAEYPTVSPNGASPTAVPGYNASTTVGPPYWPHKFQFQSFVSEEIPEVPAPEPADGEFDLENHIVGPGQSPEGAFPWMVALLVDRKGFCGASLIDNRHLLTAAHCVSGAKEVIALLGANSLKWSSDATRRVYTITTESIFQHPSYNLSSVTHDIAVIRLPENVQFSDRIRPICLPNRYYNSRFFNGEIVRVSGWGKTADSDPNISPVLKNITIAVMPNDRCRSVYRGFITGNIICTATRPNASPCKGDTGGPLFIAQHSHDSKTYYMQIGIASFGGQSCQSGYPMAFTRITAFMDFISSVTGRQII